MAFGCGRVLAFLRPSCKDVMAFTALRVLFNLAVSVRDAAKGFEMCIGLGGNTRRVRELNVELREEEHGKKYECVTIGW